jgi:hypothetical protein
MGRRFKLKSLLAIALLSNAVTACGGTSKGSGSTSAISSSAAATAAAPATNTAGVTPTGRHTKDSNDGDSDPESDDDLEVLDYGHVANAADRQAVTAVVSRYYAAAAAGDGVEACSLIYGLFAETIAEKGGRTVPPTMIENTCGASISKLFAQRRLLLTAEAAMMVVTGVRVEGKKALALLRFGSQPELRNMPMRREGGGWKVDEELDHGMP